MANLPPAGTGTEMYLAAILDALVEIDQRIEGLAADAQAGRESEWIHGEVVELREPGAVMQIRIPEEFPGSSHLYEAGITTMAAIPRDEKSLTAIPGIGKATAAAIIEALGD